MLVSGKSNLMGNFPAVIVSILVFTHVGFCRVVGRRDRWKIPLRCLGLRATSLCDGIASKRNVKRVLLDLRPEFCRLAINRDVAHAYITHCGPLTETKGANHHNRRLV